MNAWYYILAAAGGFFAGAGLLAWRWLLPRERELAALREQSAALETGARENQALRDRAVRAETELALQKNQSAAMLEEKLSAQVRIHAGEIAGWKAQLESMQEARAEAEKKWRTQIDLLKEQSAAMLEEKLSAQVRIHAGEIAGWKAQLENMQEARAEAEKRWRTQIDLLKEEFKTISAKILEERSGALRDVNQKQLSDLLNPLKERMNEFKQAVDDAKLKSVELNTGLKAQIEKVMETTRQIGSEANNLASALKGNNKTQGNWGEMILETLLEQSGLQRGVHYEVQSTLCGEDGKAVRNEESDRIMRPDVIVHYPDNREVVIDSKVSLTAYTEYVNAEEDAGRELALNRHFLSVRNHVDELAKKNYAEYVKGKSLDFVIMFIPSEAPHQAAMAADPGLWRQAFERRVLIVSPVNLMALLQIIRVAWRHDEQERNQAEILKTAGMLLDRLYAFYDTFDEVGRKLADANKAYGNAAGRLKGGDGRHGIVAPGEKLKKLGVKMKKEHALPNGLLPLEESDSDSEGDSGESETADA